MIRDCGRNENVGCDIETDIGLVSKYFFIFSSGSVYFVQIIAYNQQLRKLELY